MPDWILIAAILAVIGGFAFVAFRSGRSRKGRGQDVWIGGDLSSGGYDSGVPSWSSNEPGAPPTPDFSGGGGDFGGGGASGGWDEGGGDSGGGGDGDGGGGDGGGGDGGGGGGGGD